VKHQLLGRERDQSVCARIAGSSSREDHRYERRERASIGGSRPRDEILNILALGGSEDGEEKRRWRLAAIARGSDDAQCTSTDPAAASFVAERRTPAAAAHDLTGRTAAVRD